MDENECHGHPSFVWFSLVSITYMYFNRISPSQKMFYVFYFLIAIAITG